MIPFKMIIVPVTCALISVSAASAHDAFKEPMQKRYNFKTVSCKTCHPDNKDRSIHNKFGKLYLEALKGKDLTKKFYEAEKEGKEALKEYEKVLAKEFEKAMVVVEKEKLTVKDLLEAGLINGVRLDKKKIASSKSSSEKGEKKESSAEASDKKGE